MDNKETIIYTMPERFFAPAKKGLPASTVFFVAAGVAFVLVVGGAAWYFTRGLRVTPPAPVLQLAPQEIVTPGEPAAPEVPLSAQPSLSPIIEEPPVLPPETTLSRAADIDADGLTALEETLFKTGETQPDSDSDGYLDGHEVINLYNPGGTAPEKLEAAGLATFYKNALFSYEFLYPSGWKPEAADADGRLITFKTDTTETVSVESLDNPDDLTLSDWYRRRVNDASPVLRDITSKSGATGLATPEGLHAYFLGKKTVYVLTYHSGTEAVVNFPRAFELLQVSFRLAP
ncbi:MAG: hypothetical protein AAB444_00715 [Patescibacteria group bacterium]